MYDHFTEAAQSILNQTYSDVELVIIVDGSKAVFERARSDFEEFENVIVHQNESNKGLLSSRNIGAKLASGDIIAFIDDDALADSRWIAELLDTYQETDAIAAGGKMVPKWIADEPKFLPQEYYWLIGVTHKGFPTETTEVRNTFGSNISFLRDKFLKLDGFNVEIGGRREDVNLQGGETELCVRMRSKFGKGVIFNPDAIVSHKVFQYRTRKRWLINRAFWQGFSKRVMATITPDSGQEETEFLEQLIFNSFPCRTSQIIRNPSFNETKQFCFLIILTLAVGAGYTYGILKSLLTTTY